MIDLCWLRCDAQGIEIHNGPDHIVLCSKHMLLWREGKSPPEDASSTGLWPWTECRESNEENRNR